MQVDYKNSKDADSLYEAILKLRTLEESQRFFRDLLTPAEIEEFGKRWKIARLLDVGKPYAAIAKEVRTSTATVTRVALWLRRGKGGYKLVLERLK